MCFFSDNVCRFHQLIKGVCCNLKELVTLADLGQVTHFSDEEFESQRKVELELMADPDYKKGFSEFRDVLSCSVRILGNCFHIFHLCQIGKFLLGVSMPSVLPKTCVQFPFYNQYLVSYQLVNVLWSLWLLSFLKYVS